MESPAGIAEFGRNGTGSSAEGGTLEGASARSIDGETTPDVGAGADVACADEGTGCTDVACADVACPIGAAAEAVPVAVGLSMYGGRNRPKIFISN